MDSQVRKRKGGKGVGKEKDSLKDLTDKLGNIIPSRRDGVSYILVAQLLYKSKCLSVRLSVGQPHLGGNVIFSAPN